MSSRRVIKTGNSLAVTIPSRFAKEMGIGPGDEVEVKVSVNKTRVVVKFLKKPKQISLFPSRKKPKAE